MPPSIPLPSVFSRLRSDLNFSECPTQRELPKVTALERHTALGDKSPLHSKTPSNERYGCLRQPDSPATALFDRISARRRWSTCLSPRLWFVLSRRAY